MKSRAVLGLAALILVGATGARRPQAAIRLVSDSPAEAPGGSFKRGPKGIVKRLTGVEPTQLGDGTPARSSADDPPVLLGLYPWGGFQESVIQIEAMDEWAGIRNSIAATFMDLSNPESASTLSDELNAAWSAGYTPFINLAPSPGTNGDDCPSELSAAAIAEGSMDAEIGNWAAAFRDWAQGDESRRAFIAPLQEMNGYWICYGLDPRGYRQAFVHIQEIFASLGVPDDRVSWVFAPNGWSSPEAPPFEEYYPGNTFADAVSFSAYNWGACSPYPGDDWRSPQEIFDAYLNRMRGMAPGKPIFVAETATTSMRQDGTPGGKDEWLEAAYMYFDEFEALRGVIYFNVHERPTHPDVPDCDFPIYRPPEVLGYEGYRSAVSDPNRGYDYVSPLEMGARAFDAPGGVFEDVWPAHPFAGVPEPNWALPWIEALAASGITAGCRVEQVLPNREAYQAVSLRYYCPQATVTRAQMAVFLERGMHGAVYEPPPATGGSFNDVLAENWAAPWIEMLAEDGITAGCGGGDFCPDSPVTRAQMAVFLERASRWPDPFSPPQASGTRFSDVPSDHWAAAWVEQLAADGVTGGCSTDPPMYCPGDPVTREQMAVFLVRAFDIAVP